MSPKSRPHDHLADVYDRWLAGDESAKRCLDFYIQRLGSVRDLTLELGVGTGRITNGLATRGVPIVGLDHALPMLQQTRENQSSRSPGLIQGQFQYLPFRPVFSAVICPMRTIGHLLKPADQQAVFNEVFRVLKPGGTFTFDHYNIDLDWAQAHNSQPRVMHAGTDTTREDAAVLIWDRYDYNFPCQQLHCTVTIEQVGIEGNIYSSRQVNFDFRWFTYKEINDLAVDSGFEVVECYGDFSGAPFKESSEHMIWILRKPIAADV
jgi:SAM-dependent methyltransferase